MVPACHEEVSVSDFEKLGTFYLGRRYEVEEKASRLFVSFRTQQR